MFDIAIIGGGLAGLVSAIELSENYQVLLIEKEQYPFHKVCGEYISNESKSLLSSYNLPFEEWDLPQISQLEISDVEGAILSSKLTLGGFGISRYKLDNFLFEKAKSKGLIDKLGEKVSEITFENDQFYISTDQSSYEAKLVLGAYGKRSHLDKKLKRKFIEKRTPYLAVKYHIKNPEIKSDTISLHNFEGGYLGCSQIENDTACLCYIGSSADLRKSGSIGELERDVLMKNPLIKSLFETSQFLYPEPLVISQISFAKKEQVVNHVLMLGDSAGLITPLCGNGMSMAMHSAYLLSKLVKQFFNKELSRAELENAYQAEWQKNFGLRLKSGRLIQRNFGASWKTKLFLQSLKPFPKLQKFLISKTHGQDFY